METRAVCKTQIDAYLKKIDHYQKYPVMLPFIGKKYGEMPCKRFLIVAESFKFPHYVGADDWYAGYSGYREHSCWIDTRHIIKRYFELGSPEDNHQIHHKLREAMEEAGMPRGENPFAHVAYMNYFQRPAENQKQLDVGGKDREVAKRVFEGVLSVIKPEAVMFVSCKAWNTANTQKWKACSLDSIAHGNTCHPTGARGKYAWTRSAQPQGSTNKQIFINFIRSHVIRNPREV